MFRIKFQNEVIKSNVLVDLFNFSDLPIATKLSIIKYYDLIIIFIEKSVLKIF